MNCEHCGEEITSANERCFMDNGRVQFHRNCLLRMSIGSLAHLQEICSCYIEGSTLGDPEGMTLKQAADAAVEFWESKNQLKEQYKCH